MIDHNELQETFTHYYNMQDTENCCKLLVESATEKWQKRNNM